MIQVKSIVPDVSVNSGEVPVAEVIYVSAGAQEG